MEKTVVLCGLATMGLNTNAIAEIQYTQLKVCKAEYEKH